MPKGPAKKKKIAKPAGFAQADARSQIAEPALEPTMRALKIKFDAQVASALMGAKPGAASRVLYQLKMALDRIENFTAPVSVFAENQHLKHQISLTGGALSHLVTLVLSVEFFSVARLL